MSTVRVFYAGFYVKSSSCTCIVIHTNSHSERRVYGWTACAQAFDLVRLRMTLDSALSAS
jgi:hypothetical protein